MRRGHTDRARRCLAEARPIQHWAYFPTEESRAQFIAFIERRFSGIDSHMNPKSPGKELAITFWHTGFPDSDSMTRTIFEVDRDWMPEVRRLVAVAQGSGTHVERIADIQTLNRAAAR